jgi:polysaccharide export outer membrane protein
VKVSLSITICVFIALSDSLWAELDQSNVALDPVLTESTQSIAELNQPLPVESDQAVADSDQAAVADSDQAAVADSDQAAVADSDQAASADSNEPTTDDSGESIAESEQTLAADLVQSIATESDQLPELPSWRERYTLGPGDMVNIRFYGQAELDRAELRIAPDGTLSYLQVNSLKVSDMTIDEMREALEASLTYYYRHPRLIITPWELKSKRYVILGKVIDKGVFTLDRPITLLEAIARSRGIETGLFEQSTVEIADMDRSFIVRRGKRLDVDFSKLYFEGDLSQNVYLEPQDYIFLASNLSNEYYVLGAVAEPGAQGFSNRASIISAVTRREGFTEGSWKRRVLVIRGSLSDPQQFVVDVDAILKGRSPDFLLEPGDIVYVNNRPWYKAEQILDTAIQNFLRSATSTWVIENVPDAIQDPWFNRTGWKAPQQ